ncbi:hypothetical protein DM02DRAFT_617804 [Periconia macrospinosa]|uniref:PXA domain-containing protein n=1 Tax=Periconia macrospinosa TaxID=97972 RepID=A0A2V1DEI7_9PLEO|nr:hypothetical protein DM02DRAFT_617804 [Periconia macrospinosa]
MSDSIEPPASFREPSAETDKPDATIPSSDSDPIPPKEQSPEQDITSKEDKSAISQAPPPLDVKALTDRALTFLATASNETLGACLVGLGASTYLILGRVGLLLIGVVGGVVLHATWEGHGHGTQGHDAGQSVDRKREVGVDIARRVLDWRDKTENGNDGDKEKEGADAKEDSDLAVKLFSGKELDYSEFRPETAAALTELTDAVIRDYVKWWYGPILPTEELFPKASRQTFTAFVLSLSNHLSRKRPSDIFIDFTTRSSSFMIIIFQELSNAIMASPGDTAADAIDSYLKMKRDSTLSNILNRDYQAKQFDVAAEDVLQNYLESKTYNCLPARVFLHQILAKTVLEMIVTTCSKPEWINGWIVYLLEDGEPELMNAIDAGVEGSSSQANVAEGIPGNDENTEEDSAELRKHKRAVSKAQQAMDDALMEAQRLSQMIAEEDAKRLKDQPNPSNTSLTDDQSESTTQGIVTPTSSQSETLADNDNTSTFGGSGAPTTHSPERSLPSATTAPEPAPKPPKKESFTSFDQILPPANAPTALMDDPPPAPPPLTLHNCRLTIFDDAQPGEKAIIRNKPMVEYLIQIEPSLDYYKGWMSAKKYSDFETLHEVLRRLAPITGATGFMEAHKELPTWKNHTKHSLRNELEGYLNDAVRYKPLAESEGMKRFLDKEIGSGKSPSGGGIWPGQAFETMGKGMMDVLTKAPKEVAGGGKALFGGVTGVLGSVGTPFTGKKSRESMANTPASLSRTSTSSTPNAPIQTRHSRAESTVSELPTHIRSESTLSLAATKRTSTESLRNPNSPIIDQQPQREALMERRPSYNPDGDGKKSSRSSVYGASRSNSRAPSVRESFDLSPTMGGDQILNLPPMPSEITDDYSSSPARASTTSLSLINTNNSDAAYLPRRLSSFSLASPPKPTTSSSANPAQPTTTATQPTPSKPRNHAPLSEQETTVLIELVFAMITELYTLSSAWSLRRTLLNAAKTFLLRPGNPQLTSIQTLLQTSVLDASASDAGLAAQIRKIRANALPTADELAAWPAPLNEEEKEALRVKARKLLVERGMPQALTSVMGTAASGEALGKVFDAVQVESVARGVIFGLVLQGLRGVTQ